MFRLANASVAFHFLDIARNIWYILYILTIGLLYAHATFAAFRRINERGGKKMTDCDDK